MTRLFSADNPRKRRRCMKDAFSTAVVLILLACLLVFIYIAMLIQEIHHFNNVAFSASNTSPITFTSSEVTVKFTTVVRNTDDAYDPSTGRFVVPLDGTYMFMAQICSYVTSTLQSSDIYFAITIGNIVRSEKHVTHNSSNRTICARVVATEVLFAGEHAHVTVYSLNPNIVLDIEAANLFTGSLIHP